VSSEVANSFEEGWERLEAQLELSGGFWLGFVFSAAPQAVVGLWGKLDRFLLERRRHCVYRNVREPNELSGILPWLLTSPEAAEPDCVWIESIQSDSPGAPEQPWMRAWEQLFLRANEHRDALRARLRGGLVFAAPPSILPLVREAAPDLWSIRAIVIALDLGAPVATPQSVPSVAPQQRMAKPRMDRKSRIRPTSSPPFAPPMPNASTRPRDEDLPRSAAQRGRTPFFFTDERRQAIESLLTAGRFEEAAHDTLFVIRSLEGADTLGRASAHWLLARIHAASGRPAKALLCVESAIDNYRLFAPDHVPVEWYDQAARLSMLNDDHARAASFLGEAVEQSRKRVKAKEAVESLRELIFVLDAMGDLNKTARDIVSAEKAYDEAVIVSRRLVDLYSDVPESFFCLSTSLLGLGDVRRAKGDYAGAVAAFEETRRLTVKLTALERDPRPSLRLLSVVLNRLGSLRQETGDLDTAKQVFDEALAIRRRALTEGTNSKSLRDLASVLSKIGWLELSRGDLSSAASAIEESISLDQTVRTMVEDPREVLHSLAVALYRLGEVRQKQGDTQAAALTYEECIRTVYELEALPSPSRRVQTTREAAEKALTSLREGAR